MPTLLIGGENDRVTQLGRAPAVIVTQRRILLVDNKDPYIRVLQRNGVLRQTFGRRGAGPGEFGRYIIARYDSSTNQVVVFDESNTRLSFFRLQDSLIFIKSSVVDASPKNGCMIAGIPWQTASGTTLLRQLEYVGSDLRRGKSIGKVTWFSPVMKDPRIASSVGAMTVACDPIRQLALLAPSAIGEAHLISLDGSRQQHVRIDNFRPEEVELVQQGIFLRIPDDRVYDTVEGVLATPLGLELVIARRTASRKSREEDVVNYRRVLISESGAQRVVAQSSWRPLAVSTDGAYCYTEEPAPTLARFASGRCP